MFKIKESAPLLKKEDHIRESRTKGRFEKDYEQMFTDEIFVVAEIVRRGQLPVYYLTGYDHKAIEGTFYPEELQKLMLTRTESTELGRTSLQKGKEERKQVLEKWWGYSHKFNSWTGASHVQNI